MIPKPMILYLDTLNYWTLVGIYWIILELMGFRAINYIIVNSIYSLLMAFKIVRHPGKLWNFL